MVLSQKWKKIDYYINFVYAGNHFLLTSYPLNSEHSLIKLNRFVNCMLWFRNLDVREFIGLETSITMLDEFIITNNHTAFQGFGKFQVADGKMQAQKLPYKDECLDKDGCLKEPQCPCQRCFYLARFFDTARRYFLKQLEKYICINVLKLRC